MLTLMSVILILAAVLLIAVVLLQPGKGDMITGMSGISSQFGSMLGNRRAADILTKTTIGLAIGIFVLTLLTNVFLVGGAGQAQSVKAVTEGKAAKPLSSPGTPVMPKK